MKKQKYWTPVPAVVSCPTSFFFLFLCFLLFFFLGLTGQQHSQWKRCTWLIPLRPPHPFDRSDAVDYHWFGATYSSFMATVISLHYVILTAHHLMIIQDFFLCVCCPRSCRAVLFIVLVDCSLFCFAHFFVLRLWFCFTFFSVPFPRSPPPPPRTSIPFSLSLRTFCIAQFHNSHNVCVCVSVRVCVCVCVSRPPSPPPILTYL